MRSLDCRRAMCSPMVGDSPRVLHASLLPRISQGIASQLLLEKKACRDLGIPWETALFSPRSSLEPFPEPLNVGPPDLVEARGDSVRERLLTSRRLRRAFYAWLADRESDFDVILLRYSVHDRMQSRFIERSPAFVGLVHHSFEVDELRSVDGLVGQVRSRLESRIGAASIRGADVTVGVTDEIALHELARVGNTRKPMLIYPNGGPDTAAPVADRRSGVVHLLCASSYFSPWQGIDLLLAGLHASSREFILHLVGELSPSDALLAASDSRVVVHGPKTPQEMRDIAQTCWAGISSLAIERQGFHTACPLKVREYLSMGLPVVGNHEEVLPRDFPYYVQVMPDISSILEVVDGWRAVSRAEVSELALPLISKKAIVERFYENLTRLAQSR